METDPTAPLVDFFRSLSALPLEDQMKALSDYREGARTVLRRFEAEAAAGREGREEQCATLRRVIEALDKPLRLNDALAKFIEDAVDDFARHAPPTKKH